MADRIPCEFFLIRYVPDVVKGEFANIGVVLREAGSSSADGYNKAADGRETARGSKIGPPNGNRSIALGLSAAATEGITFRTPLSLSISATSTGSASRANRLSLAGFRASGRTGFGS